MQTRTRTGGNVQPAREIRSAAASKGWHDFSTAVPAMPNVSLFTASDPLPDDVTVSIRYTVEVDGLPVYTELYDVRKLAKNVEQDREKAAAAWIRRLDAPVTSLKAAKFSARLTAQLHEDDPRPPLTDT